MPYRRNFWCVAIMPLYSHACLYAVCPRVAVQILPGLSGLGHTVVAFFAGCCQRPEAIEDLQRRARKVVAFAAVEPLGNTLDCVSVRFTCLPAPQFTLRVAAFITSATIIYVRKHVFRDKFQLYPIQSAKLARLILF